MAMDMTVRPIHTYFISIVRFNKIYLDDTNSNKEAE